MSKLLSNLRENAQRGSKPRCHFMAHGTNEAVAARLSRIAAPFAHVRPNDPWMPVGFKDPTEPMLHSAARLLPNEVRQELCRWWLAVPHLATRTPNWDIVSACTINNIPGLLLVEAKAHDEELRIEEKGKTPPTIEASENSRLNHLKIGEAIQEASNALTAATQLPWGLSRDSHYQMANRFAWSWKLTERGIPVVLVYLGFLEASEMNDRGTPFSSAEAWEDCVRGHSKGFVPQSIWGTPMTVNSVPLIPLIRSQKRELTEEIEA